MVLVRSRGSLAVRMQLNGHTQAGNTLLVLVLMAAALHMRLQLAESLPFNPLSMGRCALRYISATGQGPAAQTPTNGLPPPPLPPPEGPGGSAGVSKPYSSLTCVSTSLRNVPKAIASRTERRWVPTVSVRDSTLSSETALCSTRGACVCYHFESRQGHAAREVSCTRGGAGNVSSGQSAAVHGHGSTTAWVSTSQTDSPVLRLSRNFGAAAWAAGPTHAMAVPCDKRTHARTVPAATAVTLHRPTCTLCMRSSMEVASCPTACCI